MKKTLMLGCIVALTLCFTQRGVAEDGDLADLRLEIEALSESITAQVKLLGIYEDLGKTTEAARTKDRIKELITTYRKLLTRLEARVGGKPNPAIGIGPGGAGGAFRGRTPRRTTGSASVKVAIDLGLEWLAAHQDPGGFWDCDNFMKMDKITPACDGAGNPLYNPGVTGLALLAFLRADQTHKHGDYRKTVREGLKYLKQIQDPEGCFGPRTTNHFTYNHAIAALAMVTAYAKTGSPLFKQSAQLAVDFIHKAQNPYLAWRYGVRPGDNDTSVTGWCAAVLVAAKSAGDPAGGTALRTDPTGIEGAYAWIQKVTEPEFGRVGYTTRGTGPARPQEMMDKFPADKSESLTAEGIFIRIAAGQDPARSEMIQKGAALIRGKLPVWDADRGSIDMYYWYWGTQAAARVGGSLWTSWSKKLEKELFANQRSDGASRGSWDPAGPWGRDGGRVFSTALMTLSLEQIAAGPVK